MTPEKKEKRAWYYRYIMIATHAIILGALGYIGHEMIPFYQEWSKKRDEDKKYNARMEKKIDKLDSAFTRYAASENAILLNQANEIANDKNDIKALKEQQSTMLETQGLMNNTISLMQQNRLGNKTFINCDGE